MTINDSSNLLNAIILLCCRETVFTYLNLFLCPNRRNVSNIIACYLMQCGS